jgi:(2R)-3-sulfolactate dehydrogenase (NADP+)
LPDADVYVERVEDLVEAMQQEPGVRLPGERRHKARSGSGARRHRDRAHALLTQLRALATAR